MTFEKATTKLCVETIFATKTVEDNSVDSKGPLDRYCGHAPPALINEMTPIYIGCLAAVTIFIVASFIYVELSKKFHIRGITNPLSANKNVYGRSNECEMIFILTMYLCSLSLRLKLEEKLGCVQIEFKLLLEKLSVKYYIFLFAIRATVIRPTIVLRTVYYINCAISHLNTKYGHATRQISQPTPRMMSSSLV